MPNNLTLHPPIFVLFAIFLFTQTALNLLHTTSPGENANQSFKDDFTLYKTLKCELSHSVFYHLPLSFIHSSDSDFLDALNQFFHLPPNFSYGNSIFSTKPTCCTETNRCHSSTKDSLWHQAHSHNTLSTVSSAMLPEVQVYWEQPHAHRDALPGYVPTE